MQIFRFSVFQQSPNPADPTTRRMSLVATNSLIDELLLEQQQLTAVEEFSQFHEQHQGPSLETNYRKLIPLNRPKEGEQYAFQVDLDACSGCKACVVACHSLNGLDEAESWRDIGALYGDSLDGAIQQTVTTACHHCADPACANGCPTLAYEKDEETGIVRHLDDQCMGCRYCELKCPYEVPKYNKRLGIVRKCDMCHGRLAAGEAPACVQACPNEAIQIKVVKTEAIAERSTHETPLLPGTVPSSITQPSTQFLNLRTHVQPADAHHHQPAHLHFPLVWMLTLTQIAAGILTADALSRFAHPHHGWILALVGVAIAKLGLAGSIAHLGRPTQAWRAFLGYKKSWLSREIIAFGAWSGFAVIYLASAIFRLPSIFVQLLGAGTILLGLAGIYCSVMVYADTKRPFWQLKTTAFRFLGNALAFASLFSPFPIIALFPICALLAFDGFILFGYKPAYERQRHLLRTELRLLSTIRLAFGALAIPLILISPIAAAIPFTVSALAGRALFFQAVEEPKMPGGIASQP